MDCPSCGASRTRVIETRVVTNGTRRRRHHCHECAHRWTTYLGEKPVAGQAGRARSARRGICSKPALTADEVRLVLTSTENGIALGRMLGRTHQAISAIRLGKIHREVCPELPRLPRRGEKGLTCLECQHWEGGACGMGFPDPLEDGPAFAADCSLYSAV